MPDVSIELFVAGAGPAYTDRLGATGAAYLVRSGSRRVKVESVSISAPAQ